jgi:uncharacterized protein
MMNAKDNRIFNEFVLRVRKQFPEARIWAHGSRARGDANWDSDFDIFIVLEEVDNSKYQWIRNVAWEIGFKNNLVISTVLIDRDAFEKGPMSESTLVESILQQGIAA